VRQRIVTHRLGHRPRLAGDECVFDAGGGTDGDDGTRRCPGNARHDDYANREMRDSGHRMWMARTST
jgi:hypothetical protein